jgi:hypothetical protein
MVRIRSDHAIGFLKGRFHSLKHLRLRISDERSHKFATYWIAACIRIHASAKQCEDEEREDDSDYEDPFIAEGLSSSDSDSDVRAPRQPPHISQHCLHAAKAKREKLKRALFRAKEKRRRDREMRMRSSTKLRSALHRF